MKLSQLFVNSKVIDDREVKAITFDSRNVDEFTVFVAIRGSKVDGHTFIPEVLKKNPAAIVVESGYVEKEAQKFSKIEVAHTSTHFEKVPDTRVELERLARFFYGDPAEKLYSVAVTGTNGKTSITYMVEAVLNHLGQPTGVIGTVNHHLGTQNVWNTELTTPDALTLQKRLADFVSLGAKAVAFEASSHALSQNRVGSIAFDAMIFTNLTRDHLDYHKTMEEYFLAKEKLFRELPAQIKTQKQNQPVAIINYSDAYGPKIRVAPNVKLWSYGEAKSGAGDQPSAKSKVDFEFEILKSDFAGTSFKLTALGEAKILHIPLVGKHNVYNAVAALAVGMATGATLEAAHAGLKNFTGVPGRLQRVQHSQDLNVFVDYAHTDDALKTVLSALQDIRKSANLKNKIITVFGCGGDRDKGKRPLMLKAAMAGSDKVVITSDNPRTESPASIIDDILTGVMHTKSEQIVVEVDRKQAINKAIEMARPGDVVLIAGKGHEDYQIIGTQKLPFSDFAVAEGILNGL
jgi:UDP-N-acetylmuramoyl-L-alanyl-D-glutamate--2,6-diaminopimelate ligase